MPISANDHVEHIKHTEPLEEVVEVHHVVERSHKHDAQCGIGKATAEEGQVEVLNRERWRHHEIHHDEICKQHRCTNNTETDVRQTHHLLQPPQREEATCHIACPCGKAE